MPRVLTEAAGINDPSRYVEDIALHDNALWSAMTDAKWAGAGSQNVNIEEGPGGTLDVLRVIARRPGSSSSKADWWIIERSAWEFLGRLAAQPGVVVKVGFVDEHGRAVALRPFGPRLKAGRHGPRFYVLRPGRGDTP